jgi:hypothetical protein
MKAKIQDKVEEAHLSSEQVWRHVARASFAVLSHVTPSGEPRSSGVVYRTLDSRIYVAVAPDSWKARHIAVDGRVSLTVPVHRGGVLALLMPIPPATISFRGRAIVHPAGSPEVGPLLDELGSLLPAERRTSAVIIEVVPEGAFVTYGIGISLGKMCDPGSARARVPVT